MSESSLKYVVETEWSQMRRDNIAAAQSLKDAATKMQQEFDKIRKDSEKMSEGVVNANKKMQAQIKADAYVKAAEVKAIALMEISEKKQQNQKLIADEIKKGAELKALAIKQASDDRILAMQAIEDERKKAREITQAKQDEARESRRLAKEKSDADKQAARDSKAAAAQIAADAKKKLKAETQWAKYTVQAMKEIEREQKQALNANKRFTQELRAGLNDIQNGIRDMQTILGAVAGTITVLAGGSAKAFGEFEAGLNSFQAKSEASKEEMADFSKEAMKLGQESKFSSKEVVTAGVELVKMGFSATQATASMRGIITASEASGESLADVSRVMSQVINVFGYSASESSKVADYLIKISNLSATDIPKLSYAITEAGAVAEASGVKFTTLGGILAYLSQQGIDSSKAGTEVKDMLLRLQAPTKETTDALKTLGLTLEKDLKANGKLKELPEIFDILRDSMKGLDTTDKNQKLKEIFGLVAVPSAATLINGTSEAIHGLVTEVENATGYSEEAAGIMRQGLVYQFEMLAGAAETAAIALGEQMAPGIGLVLEELTGLIDGFNELDPVWKSLIANSILLVGGLTGIGLIAVTAGLGFTKLVEAGLAARGMYLALTGATAAATTATVAATGAQSAAQIAIAGTAATVRAAIMSTYTALIPWLPMIGAVALAVGALYVAYKTNFGGIRDAANWLMSWFGTDFVNGWKSIFQYAASWVKWFSDLTGTAFQVIKDTALTTFGLLDKIINSLVSGIGRVGALFGAILSGDFAQAKDLATQTLDDIKNLFNDFTSDDLLEKARENARDKFAKGFEAPVKVNFTGGGFAQSAGLSGLVPQVAGPGKDILGAREQREAEKAANKDAKEAAKERLNAIEKEIEGLKRLRDQKEQDIKTQSKLTGELGKSSSSAAIEAKKIADASVKGFDSISKSVGMCLWGVKQLTAAGKGLKNFTSENVSIGMLGGTGAAYQAAEALKRDARYIEVSLDKSKAMAGQLKKGDIAVFNTRSGFSADYGHIEMADPENNRMLSDHARKMEFSKQMENNVRIFRLKGMSDQADAESKLAKAQAQNANDYLKKLVAIEQRLKAQGATSEELKKIGDEIHAAKMDAGAKEIDLIEARKKAEADAMKDLQAQYSDYLKSVLSSYDELEKRAKTYYDDLAKNIDDFNEKQELEGMSPVDKQKRESKAALDKTDNVIVNLLAEELKLTEQINQLKTDNKGVKETAEIHKQINELMEKQKLVSEDINLISAARLEQREQEAAKIAEVEFNERRAQEVADFDKQEQAVNDLIGNKDALRQFYDDVQTGIKSFDDLSDGLGVTAQQADRLNQAFADMAQEDMGAIIDQAVEAWGDQVPDALDKAGQAVNIVGNLFGEAGRKAASMANSAINGVQSITAALTKGDTIGAIMAGIGTYADIIAGAFFPDQEKLNQQKERLLSDLTKVDREIMQLRIERLNKAGDFAGAAQVELEQGSMGIDDQISEARKEAEAQIKELYDMKKNIFGVVTEDLTQDITVINNLMINKINELENKRKEIGVKGNAEALERTREFNEKLLALDTALKDGKASLSDDAAAKRKADMQKELDDNMKLAGEAAKAGGFDGSGNQVQEKLAQLNALTRQKYAKLDQEDRENQLKALRGLEDDFEQGRIDLMQDGLAKTLTEIRLGTKQKKDALRDQMQQLSKEMGPIAAMLGGNVGGTPEQRAQMKVLQDQMRQAETEGNKLTDEANKRFNQDQYDLAQEHNKNIIDLKSDGLEKSLAQIQQETTENQRALQQRLDDGKISQLQYNQFMLDEQAKNLKAREKAIDDYNKTIKEKSLNAAKQEAVNSGDILKQMQANYAATMNNINQIESDGLKQYANDEKMKVAITRQANADRLKAEQALHDELANMYTQRYSLYKSIIQDELKIDTANYTQEIDRLNDAMKPLQDMKKRLEQQIKDLDRELRDKLNQFKKDDFNQWNDILKNATIPDEKLREALKLVANPADTTITATASAQLQQRAMEKYFADEKTKLDALQTAEEITPEQYNKQLGDLIILRGKFYDGLRKMAGLSHDDQLKYLVEYSNSYKDFQDLQIRLMTEKADLERSQIQQSIDDNQDKQDSIQKAIDANQAHITEISKTYQEKLDPIDKAMAQVNSDHLQWQKSLYGLGGSVTEVLSKINSQYLQTKGLIGSGLNVGSVATNSSSVSQIQSAYDAQAQSIGGSYTMPSLGQPPPDYRMQQGGEYLVTDGSGKYYKSTSDMTRALRGYDDGLITRGDGLRLIHDGEGVLPEKLTKLLLRASDAAINNNTSNNNIIRNNTVNVYGPFGSDVDVVGAVGQALAESEARANFANAAMAAPLQ